MLMRGFQKRVWPVLIWGANCNNGLHVGAAFNVNNPFSNSNWNIGPSHAYLFMGLFNQMLLIVLPRWALKHVYRKELGEIKPAAEIRCQGKGLVTEM